MGGAPASGWAGAEGFEGGAGVVFAEAVGEAVAPVAGRAGDAYGGVGVDVCLALGVGALGSCCWCWFRGELRGGRSGGGTAGSSPSAGLRTGV